MLHSANRIARLPLVVAALVVIALGPRPGWAFVESLFAPSAELWDRWAAHDASATDRIDHAAWQAFLDRHVQSGPDGVNRIGYGNVTADDRAVLDRYIARLAATPISRYSRGEQQAYWINLYNALTVQVILNHMPVDSIRDIDISPGLFADGPWGKKLVTIEGEAVSLNDIEHRILRPIWRDPRIHYAVNCAAIGCPNLQSQAFTAENAEALLDKGAREYVNHPRGVRLEDGRLRVSSIYVWFQEDFGGSDAAVIAHLGQYAEADLGGRLASASGIDGHDYDWALNQ